MRLITIIAALLLALTIASASPSTITSNDIRNVTVFVDRAEITRAISLADGVLTKPGQHDVVVKGLPATLDPDSLRVRVLDPRVKLLELSHEKRWTHGGSGGDSDAEAGTAKAKRGELEARIKELEGKVTEDKQALQRLATELELIERYAQSTTGPPNGAAAGPIVDVATVGKVLELYATRAADIDGRRNALERAKGEKESALSALRRQLNALGHGLRRRAGDARAAVDVTLALEVSDTAAHVDGDAPSLQLVYMVRGARWSPSYDIRVAENEDEGLELTYFGRITQNTGEDWTDARLQLSTATPSVGGRPPSIGTKIARFRRPRVPMHYQNRMAKVSKRSTGRKMRMMQRQDMAQQAAPMMAAESMARGGAAGFAAQTNFMEEADDEILLGEAPPFEGVSDAATAVATGATSAAFVIERPTTIASDNKPHKVTVAAIRMKVSRSYYAVPALEAKAYFSARASNPSDYPLLPGSANVFFGSQFVGQTQLESCNPGESFSMFLGVDSAVKVTVKPVKKRRSTRGILSKSANVAFEHRVSVKNTKGAPVRLTVAMSLPRSTDEDISVKLLAPTEKELENGGGKPKAGRGAPGADGVAVTAEGGIEAAALSGDDGDWATRRVLLNPQTNNLVWLLQVPAGATENVVLEYEIETPAGKEAEIV